LKVKVFSKLALRLVAIRNNKGGYGLRDSKNVFNQVASKKTLGLLFGLIFCHANMGFAQNLAVVQEVSLNSHINPDKLYTLNGPSALPVQAEETLDLKLSMLSRPEVASVDHSAQSAHVWEELRKGFAIPDLNTPLVRQQEKLLKANPRMVEAMLEQARPFLYFIVEECNQRGLPLELALLPFIESRFNPQARSPAAAEGLWQFIPSTGRYFDLKQNRYVDQRRDLLASTRAALDYLSYLYEMHGNWYLALISYNWGEGSVLKAVQQAKASGKSPHLLQLRLPKETQDYIPKLQAVKNLILNPEGFNIALPDIANKPYFKEIPRHKNLDLRELARRADIDLASIKKLNSALNQPILLAQHSNTLLVPWYHEEKVQDTLKILDAETQAQDLSSGTKNNTEALYRLGKNKSNKSFK
jgi:membrane-bound lytic murein transglycosylase D